MSAAGLRAKLRLVTYYHPTPEPVWEWTIPHHDPHEKPWGQGSDYDLGRAIAEANQFVRGILSDRTDEINRGENIVVDCSECGDPSEYEEYTHPGGVTFTCRCASCGADYGDSA